MTVKVIEFFTNGGSTAVIDGKCCSLYRTPSAQFATLSRHDLNRPQSTAERTFDSP